MKIGRQENVKLVVENGICNTCKPKSNVFKDEDICVMLTTWSIEYHPSMSKWCHNLNDDKCK